MKKKLAVLLGVLVLSSVSFAAPKTKAAAKPAGGSIESSLSNLENQLTKLQQMETKTLKYAYWLYLQPKMSI